MGNTMTNTNILLFIPLLLCNLTYGQSKYEGILTDFYNTTDDSIFISKYSKEPYQKYTAQRYFMSHSFDLFSDSLVFYHYKKGDIFGPYEQDSSVFYVKVTNVDSSLRMRVGNIYLDPQIKGNDKIDNLALQILRTAQKKNNFDDLCKKYKDDSNSSYDCDLGWFFEGAMVIEFEKEVKKHVKGEYFIVATRFGKHVVKVIDNPIRDKCKAEYIFLYLDK